MVSMVSLVSMVEIMPLCCETYASGCHGDQQGIAIEYVSDSVTVAAGEISGNH